MNKNSVIKKWEEFGATRAQNVRQGGREMRLGEVGLRLCGTWKARLRHLDFLSPLDLRYPLYKSIYPLYA